jgi:hypothetical protein
VLKNKIRVVLSTKQAGTFQVDLESEADIDVIALSWAETLQHLGIATLDWVNFDVYEIISSRTLRSNSDRYYEIQQRFSKVFYNELYWSQEII